MRWLPLLWLLAGCDDALLRPCGTYTPDWAGVQCMMDTHCASCHSGYYPVVLPDDVAEDVWFERGWYVRPGDLQGSKLWRVLSGALCTADDPACPDPDVGVMPLGGEPLPRSEWAHVEAWILAGAEVGE